MLVVKDLEDQCHYEIRVVEKNISKFADFIDFFKSASEKHDHLDVVKWSKDSKNDPNVERNHKNPNTQRKI